MFNKTTDGHSPLATEVASFENEYPPVRKRIGGGFANVCLALIVIFVPLAALSAALMVLIWKKQLLPNPVTSASLFVVPNQDDPSVFLVDISAPTFLTIASWSSSVVPALTGFAMTLLSFPVARTIKEASLAHRTRDLPTPFQLSLILGFLQGGGFSTTWKWMKYQFGWNDKREKSTRPLRSSVLVTLLVLLLGACIVGTDTWLHLTTTTIEYVRITPYDATPPLFSLSLPPSCYDTKSSYATGCILNPSASTIYLIGADAAQRTLSNVSSEHSVNSVFRSSTPSVFLGPASISALATHSDFEASSIAISSQCTPSSRACGLTAPYGASTPFNCYSGSFHGDLTSNSWYMGFFSDSSRSSNNTLQSSSNPFYWNAANLNQNSAYKQLQADPEIVTPFHGGVAWVMACTSTAYLATYSFGNGTLDSYSISKANNSVADVLMAPLAYTTTGELVMQQAAINADLESSAQGVADSLALAFSQVALSLASGVMVPQPASQFQIRTSQLVARIPKAPLFALLAANLLLAVVAVVLASVALKSMTGSSGKELSDVQARLTDVGVVAAAFELQKVGGVKEVEELFDERKGNGSQRVGILDGPAGWNFALWNMDR